MFRVSISSLGSLLACCTFGTVLLAWLWSEYSDSLKRRRFEKRRRQCRLCFFEFLAPEPEQATPDGPTAPPCPRCGAPGAGARSPL